MEVCRTLSAMAHCLYHIGLHLLWTLELCALFVPYRSRLLWALELCALFVQSRSRLLWALELVHCL